MSATDCDPCARAFESLVWSGGEPQKEADAEPTERASFLDLAGWTFTASGNWRREYRGRRLVIHCHGPCWRWRVFGPAGEVVAMRGAGHDSPRQCAAALFEELTSRP
jgi:hypothetical protein